MEFQAIVMAAGKGSRMMEVTSGTPKSLLPIGNVPLIKSCLNTLKNFGIQNIIVMVPEADKYKIQDVVETKCDLKVEIIPISKNNDWGTADSLRSIYDKIHSDVLIMSCDLVSNFNLRKMANQHRKYDSTLTMLFTPFPKSLKDAMVPGHKSKNKAEKDIIGLDSNGRIMFFNSEADFEDGVPLKLSVLNEHPVFQVHSNLVDAHVYMMKKSVIDFLMKKKQISTFKGEFLPVIVSEQFNSKSTFISPDPASNEKEQASIFDLKSLALELSSFSNNSSSLENNYCCDSLKCYAYIDNEAFCTRANTLVGYMDINRQISKYMESTMGVSKKPSPFPKSQVDNDSILGEGCLLEQKSSIKQSVIGNNCNFGEKAKVSGSVLMDGVTVGSGTTIQGCIICSNVNVGNDCELKNCVVGPDQVVKDVTKLINEVVQRTYEFMEI